MTGSKSRVLRGLFVREQGLRAGWSVLIFLAIVVVLSALGGTLVGHFFPVEDMHVVSPDTQILREAAVVLGLFIATWVMSKIEKRPVLSYGLTDSRMVRRFFFGLAVGLLSISALVGALWTTHLLVFDGRVLSGAAIWKYAALWAALDLLVAFFEEGLFRGYLLYTLTRGLNFWWAALITSVLFGAAHGHNAGESPMGLITAALGGLVFCLSLWLTGSLWFAIGMHTGMNWAEAYLYGVIDSGSVSQGRLLESHPVGAPIWSGGTTGPEGSVFALLVLGGMATAIWLTWGRNRAAASGRF
ncbi:MAG TPA: type II CAAX endopeptidase family protein [Terriglobales bacterium]|nr:type II CAAX endopeptidase family protein [Terriglobales bacterium]